MKRVTYFKKLLMTIYTVIFVCILIAAAILFFSVKHYSENEIHQKNQIYIDQTRISVDNRIGVAKSLADQLVSNREVVLYVTHDTVDSHNILMVYQEMGKMMVPFHYLSLYIGVGQKEHDTVITTQGTIEEKRFYKQMQFGFKDKEALYEDLATVDKGDVLIIPSTSSYYGNDFINLIFTKSYSNDNDLIVYQSFFKNTLLPSLADNQTGVLYAVKDGGIIASKHSGMTEEEKAFIDDAFLTGTLTEYNVYESPSQEVGWRYVYVTPKTLERNLLSQMLTVAALTLFTLMTVGGIIAYLIVKKTYRPIDKMMAHFDQEGDLVNEFDIVTSASIRMKEANDKLQAIIMNERAPLRSKFMRDLLYGINRKEDLEGHLEKYGLQSFREGIRVMVLEFMDLQELQTVHLDEEITSIRGHINAIIRENLSEVTAHYQLVDIDQKKTALVFAPDDYEQVHGRMAKTLEAMERDYNIRIDAAFGKKVSTIEGVSDSFSDALKNLDYRAIVPDIRLLTGDEVITRKDTYYYPLDMEQNLIGYLLAGKKEEADMVIEHLMHQNLHVMQLSNEALALLAFGIVGTINRVLYQINKTVEDVYGEGIMVYLELRSTTNRQAFNTKVVHLFHQLSDELMVERKTDEASKLGDRIMTYIHDNYASDISLNDIASHFGVTPAYVSMLFKKEHGYNFKDYLNMYRIDEVKKCIHQNPYATNQALAMKVGYNSVNTFLRIFKKYEGITPGKYSESIQKKMNG